MKKNVDVFFIVDRSKAAAGYLDNINTFLRAMVNSMIISRYLQNHNIYVNIFTFGGDFSKSRNVIVMDKPLNKLDDIKIKISSSVGSADPEGALRSAVSHGMSRYDEWILKGEEAERPVYFFISGGHLEPVDSSVARRISIQKRYKNAAAMVRECTADGKLRFYICAVDTYNKTADTDTLGLLTTNSEKQIIKIFSAFMYSESDKFIKVLSDFEGVI